MTRSLGKMSVYKLFNYVDQPGLLLSQMQIAVA